MLIHFNRCTNYHSKQSKLLIASARPCLSARVGTRYMSIPNLQDKGKDKKGKAIPLQAWTGPEGSGM
jgi:hypothetical protein